MNKDFVKYQEALDLKQLGFDEPCFGSWEVEKTNIPTYTHSVTKFYKNSDHPTGKTSAPTCSQAFRWFREKYGLSGTVKETFVGDDRCGIICVKSEKGLKYLKSGESVTTKFFKEYEEAEKACLIKLIEIIKEKQI
jgi:hypothetical protein